MAGYLLDQGATVLCMHSGQAQPATVNQRVKAGGQLIVTQSGSHTVSGCPYQIGNVKSPCTAVQWTSAASRVKAGGEPVLLADSQATCTPNGTGVNIVTTQTRVKGS